MIDFFILNGLLKICDGVQPDDGDASNAASEGCDVSSGGDASTINELQF